MGDTATRGDLVQTVKKGARLTGAERDQMTQSVTELYQEGKSIRDIAQETGRSYGFVHRVLSESEVVLRGRGGATRRRPT
jgi:transposase-like protein